MSYQSFYGGRKGASFILVEKYNSYQEMIECFKQGDAYTTVGYDEYVIINSLTEENGSIYRRGYDYNNDMGGAIFVGKISGPRGPRGIAPVVSIDSFDEIAERPEDKQQGSYSVEANDLIPGKYVENGEIKFNDNINWICCSFGDDDFENPEAYAYIGFTFPYTIFDFEAETVSPYYTENLITRLDDQTHPFYQNMKILIPAGKSGNSIKNIRVGLASEITEDYNGKQDDIENNRYVFMCDHYDYANSELGEKTVLYLGDYNMVKDIVLDTDGTLIIHYTHEDRTVYNKKIKWITDVAVDVGAAEGEGTQQLIINYNTGETEVIGKPVNYIMRTAVTSDYHLLFLYSDPERRKAIIEAGKNAVWEGRNDWEDLGSIKQYNGILIGLNLTVADNPQLSTVAGTLEYLNATYPNGLIGIDLQGKVISVTKNDDTIFLYAFDYTITNNQYKGWFSLGGFTVSAEGGTVVGAEGDAITETLANQLPYQGIWFITEE